MDLPQEILDDLPSYRAAVALARCSLHGDLDSAVLIVAPMNIVELRKLTAAQAVLASSSIREALGGREDLADDYLDHFAREFAKH
jgi:hypothetical protein